MGKSLHSNKTSLLASILHFQYQTENRQCMKGNERICVGIGQLIDRSLLGRTKLWGTPDEGLPLPFWTARSFRRIAAFQAHILDKRWRRGA